MKSFRFLLFTGFTFLCTFLLVWSRGEIEPELKWQFTGIGVLSIIGMGLTIKRQPISLSLIHWFFIFIFFFITPLVRLEFNLFPLLKLSNNLYAVCYTTNTIILLWSILYFLFYELSYHNKLSVSFRVTRRTDAVKHLAIYGAIGIIILLGIYIFIQKPIALVSRGGGITMFTGGGGIISLFFKYLFRPLPFYLMATYLVLVKVRKKPANKLLLFGLISAFLLFNFPTGTARFYAFAIWISILYLFFFQRLRSGLVAAGILFFGILGAEFTSQFRRLQDLSNLETGVQFDLSSFGQMDFDAYEMLGSMKLYTEKFGYTYGDNFLGAALFFVPRSFWEEKPISSGSEVMREYYKYNNPYIDFDNVSAPLVGEFYFAFSWIGLILGAILIAVLSGILDYSFKYMKDRNHIVLPFFQLFYIPIVGLFLFVMRGSLLNGVSFIMGMTTAFVLANYLFGVQYRDLKLVSIKRSIPGAY